jgi:hypothetical protein
MAGPACATAPSGRPITGKLHKTDIDTELLQPDPLPDSVRMTPKPRHLPDALAQSEAGAALIRRCSQSQRAAAVIDSECADIVPGFSPIQSRSCELRGTTLRVNAQYPAQVAKLRQAVPRLLSRLQQQGLDVIEIKIGVQPRALSSSVQQPAPDASAAAAAGGPCRRCSDRQIAPALKFAKKLALTLEDSPLRTAALRLAASLAAGLTKTRELRQASDQQDREKNDT